jgi:hypothetical protein
VVAVLVVLRLLEVRRLLQVRVMLAAVQQEEAQTIMAAAVAVLAQQEHKVLIV